MTNLQPLPARQGEHRRLTVVPPVVLVEDCNPDRHDRDHHWSDDAACKGKTGIMFPNGRGIRDCDEAQAVCAGCAVIVDCREYIVSMKARPVAGVWAGMVPDEWKRARRLRRQRQERA